MRFLARIHPAWFHFNAMRGFTRFFLVCVVCALTACSTVKKDETRAWSAQTLYAEAKNSLDRGSLDIARDYYQKLLSRFPFGRYAQQSQLDMIYLNYEDREYDQVVESADKFLKIYPRSPYADYARYMKGVATYSRDLSIFDRIVPTDIAQSDAQLMKKAYDYFAELVKVSPDGQYSADARQRMVYLYNVMAAHEIYVARYYLRRGAYLAAVNRAQYVLDNFARASVQPQALAVLVRGYQLLNLPELAADAQKVLNFNYPNIAQTDTTVQKILNGDLDEKRGIFSQFFQSLGI